MKAVEQFWLAHGVNLLTILGMFSITVAARSFFFMFEREWKLPHWAQRGLQYAPIAALAAVITPEVVMTQGHLIDTLRDARVCAVTAGVAFFYWREGRGQVVLGTIAVGMLVYLPLHLLIGW